LLDSDRMKRLLIVVLMGVLGLTGPSAAQLPPPAKATGEAVQHGAQPNPEEVRPGTRDGDAPSAAAGELVRKSGRRVLGLPVNSVLVIAGALVVLLILAGLIIPGAGRRLRARGGGTYGR
jgi:hypothetical protein